MSPDNMVRPDDEFGKDEGLIHEVVVTGRKAGAGKEFWARLAHDEELFKRVVWLVMNPRVESEPVRVGYSPIVKWEELPLRIERRDIGKVTIFDCVGTIEIDNGTDILRGAVKDFLAKGGWRLLLNMSGVRHVDSIGVSMLVGAFTEIRDRGGMLKFCNITQRLAELFHQTKLDTIFEVSKDEASAVASFT